MTSFENQPPIKRVFWIIFAAIITAIITWVFTSYFENRPSLIATVEYRPANNGATQLLSSDFLHVEWMNTGKEAVTDVILEYRFWGTGNTNVLGSDILPKYTALPNFNSYGAETCTVQKDVLCLPPNCISCLTPSCAIKLSTNDQRANWRVLRSIWTYADPIKLSISYLAPQDRVTMVLYTGGIEASLETSASVNNKIVHQFRKILEAELREAPVYELNYENLECKDAADSHLTNPRFRTSELILGEVDGSKSPPSPE